MRARAAMPVRTGSAGVYRRSARRSTHVTSRGCVTKKQGRVRTRRNPTAVSAMMDWRARTTIGVKTACVTVSHVYAWHRISAMKPGSAIRCPAYARIQQNPISRPVTTATSAPSTTTARSSGVGVVLPPMTRPAIGSSPSKGMATSKSTRYHPGRGKRRGNFHRRIGDQRCDRPATGQDAFGDHAHQLATWAGVRVAGARTNIH